MRLIVLASRAVDLDRRIYRVVCFVVSRMAAVVVSGVVRVEGRGAQYELNVSYVEIARVATSPSGVGLSWMGRDEKAEEIKEERKKKPCFDKSKAHGKTGARSQNDLCRRNLVWIWSVKDF